MQTIKITDEQGVVKKVVLDGYVKRALDKEIARQRAGFQIINIVTGLGGVGKSEMVKAMAYYQASVLGTPFSVDNIHFEAEGLTEALSTCPELSVQILDESTKDFSTTASRTTDFAHLINYLNLCRVKKCCTYLILPDFFALSKTLACFLSNLLFVVYDKLNERGYVLCYERKAKNKLYHLGKRMSDYNVVMANFHASFQKCPNLIDDVEYDKRKIAYLASQAHKQPKNTLGIGTLRERGRMNNILRYKEQWPVEKRAKFFRVGVRTIQNVETRYNKLCEIEGLDDDSTS